jgi:NADPH-dependent stearoyl-CoA 9-desaturase
MAISDVQAYAHLSVEDVAEFGREVDAIRREVEESLGKNDERYIRRVIAVQRACEAAGRATLFASRKNYAWLTGTVLLASAKIIENMEIGHNVMHGQWD